jgi:mono/diheme cytochrome c family protein
MKKLNKGIRRMLYLFFILTGCTAEKMLYDFPEQMRPEVRAEYQKMSDEGYKLYRGNCAGCHTKNVDGKNVIPDFSQDQLRGYELREANKKHEVSLSEAKVTGEELGKIMIFLMYKKKNK